MLRIQRVGITAFLWPPCVADADIIFSSCGFFFFLSSFFPRLISDVAGWMSTILPHVVWACGLSANLGCRFETCCIQLAENTGRKNRQKFSIWAQIVQLCRAISSQQRHVSTIGKLVKQQYLLQMSPQCDKLRPTSGWYGPVVWGTSSTGRQPNCGVEQRAPPIFGRAVITLGIGPHSSYHLHCVSKNVPSLTCYNLYIHGSIATIFGKNVAEKVGNQNILYFPTSPN